MAVILDNLRQNEIKPVSMPVKLSRIIIALSRIGYIHEYLAGDEIVKDSKENVQELGKLVLILITHTHIDGLLNIVKGSH